MHTAMRILRDEHRSIAAVLQALQHLARDAVDPAVRPGFDVFRAMIHYIDTFPERLHHPKEDRYLFARLESRAPEARPLLEDLRAEHVERAARRAVGQLRGERHAARDHLEQDAAQRVEVGRGRARAVVHQLRRHVAR